jgi:hypothetical protein
MSGEQGLPLPRRNYALENYCDCLAAIRMIREAVETLGPPGVLPSEEAVLQLYGPEAVHEAQAIVDALRKMLANEQQDQVKTRPGA